MDRAIGPDRLSLGVEFLNRILEMTVDNYKVACLLELLNTKLSIDQKCSTEIMTAILIGNVYTATITYAWLQ